MSSSRLRELFSRYYNDSCSEQEREELMQLIKLSMKDDELRQAIDAAIAETKEQYFLPDEVSQDMLKAILQPKEIAPVVRMKRNWLLRSGWAAAILVVLATATYVVFNHTATEAKPDTNAGPEQLPAKGNDISPGGNKAILTLGNGQKIILDSAQNGLLAKQGNSSVVKESDGQLKYAANEKSNQLLFNSIATPRGGQYHLILPDGSKVWLNAESSLVFPVFFTGLERKVELTGEGYFEVAKRPGMPFKVIVNNHSTVEVLGTHFNVMAYSNEQSVQTTLLEGAVKITTPVSAIRLKPGQQAIMNKDGQISRQSDVDTIAAIAWKNGLFKLTMADVQTVMHQLERWYDVNVVYENGIPEGHIEGTIPRDMNLMNVIKLLDINGIHCRLENRKLIVK